MASGRCAPETFGHAHCYSHSRARVIVMANESVRRAGEMDRGAERGAWSRRVGNTMATSCEA
jgi:hypothetical protein